MSGADLAAFWLAETPTSEADGMRERLETAGYAHSTVGSLTGAESGMVVLVAMDDDDAAEVSRRAAAAIGGEAEAPLLYRRRFTTDPARSGLFGSVAHLFSVRVFAPPEWQQPIRSWLDEEHFDLQTGSLDEVLWSEGYEPLAAEFHFLNLWAITDPSVIDSPEWAAVRDTPWWNRVLPGFHASRVAREVYRVSGA